MFLAEIFLAFTIAIVAAKECPKKTADQCSKYEEFYVNDVRGKTNGLGSLLTSYRCQNTCRYYGRNFDCKVDNIGDCYCKEGYARIEECGECVSVKTNATCKAALPATEESCRRKPNEVFLSTGPRCPGDCINLKSICPTIMTHNLITWQPVCDCKDGYARLPNGFCVLKTNAYCVALYDPSPENCRRIGELFSPGGSACQRGCDDYSDSNFCYESETNRVDSEQLLILQPACYCRKGWTRNLSGRCIPVSWCPM